jgi:hypothetical protein
MSGTSRSSTVIEVRSTSVSPWLTEVDHASGPVEERARKPDEAHVFLTNVEPP